VTTLRTKRIIVSFTADEHRYLQKTARATGLSMSEYIRQTLRIAQRAAQADAERPASDVREY
jgi:post-segregation antitoxin (ccd killing protein)